MKKSSRRIRAVIKKLSEIPGIDKYVKVKNKDFGPDVTKVQFTEIAYFPVSISKMIMDDTRFNDGDRKRSPVFIRVSGYDYIRKRKFYMNTGSEVIAKNIKDAFHALNMSDGGGTEDGQEREFSCTFVKMRSPNGGYEYYSVAPLQQWQIEAAESDMPEVEYVKMLLNMRLLSIEELKSWKHKSMDIIKLIKDLSPELDPKSSEGGTDQ